MTHLQRRVEGQARIVGHRGQSPVDDLLYVYPEIVPVRSNALKHAFGDGLSSNFEAVVDVVCVRVGLARRGMEPEAREPRADVEHPETVAADLADAESVSELMAEAGGIDVFYPPENQARQEALFDRGLVLAEMPPGTVATRWMFPARNRLIAALTGMTVVVQPNVVTPDERAGVQTGELLLIEEEGAKVDTPIVYGPSSITPLMKASWGGGGNTRRDARRPSSHSNSDRDEFQFLPSSCSGKN